MLYRFGDRIFAFGGHNFRHVTRKEAVDRIRSCDLTTVTMEIGRVSTNIKPSVMVSATAWECTVNRIVPVVQSFSAEIIIIIANFSLFNLTRCFDP